MKPVTYVSAEHIWLLDDRGKSHIQLRHNSKLYRPTSLLWEKPLPQFLKQHHLLPRDVTITAKLRPHIWNGAYNWAGGVKVKRDLYHREHPSHGSQ